jgi:predicted glycosyltransferase involved in capsule biosynthesis
MSKNITFVTHLRYDHDDRLDNLQTIIDYYSHYFPESKFIFVEDDKEHNKKFDSIKWHKKTTFYFLKNDSVYYRTRALNFGIKQAQTPIVVSLDTDCIVKPESVKLCEEALLKDSVAAWPYNGYFLDIDFDLKTSFKNSKQNFNILIDNLDNNLELPLSSRYKHCLVRCTNNDHLGTGGIVMFNKEKFTSVGGYNQNFIAWGCEDNEIVVRLKTLKLKTFRDTDKQSICFHLFHRNAMRSENPYYNHNFDIIHKVQEMSESELKSYINSWNSFK